MTVKVIINKVLKKVRELICGHVYAVHLKDYGLSQYQQCVKCGLIKE